VHIYGFVNRLPLLFGLIAAMFSFFPARASASDRVISGMVTNTAGEAVAGASVLILADDSLITGIATDLEGYFRLRLSAVNSDSLTAKVSSIGYVPKEKTVQADFDSLSLDFQIDNKDIDFGQVIVAPQAEPALSKSTLSRSEIAEVSMYSLVPSNPVSAIRQPQVVRQGSYHSSKIRISGTNPRYYLNGIEIGQDPNHYGMFSIVPGSVVDKIMIYPKGTPALYGLPTIVEMKTPRPFRRHVGGDIEVSLVEATGSASIGGERYYILTSLRKSVLDKLVYRFDIHSDRRTIPPTNFQDLFFSSGWRLTDNSEILVDQYQIRDFLSYRTEPTTANPNGIDTYQKTDEYYLGTRLVKSCGSTLVNFHGSYRSTHEEYHSIPVDVAEGSGLHVALDATRRIGAAGMEATFFPDQTELTFGGQLHYTLRRAIDMTQTNWNFLPPDVASDNPYLYQPELNQIFGRYKQEDKELDGAGYFIYKRHFRQCEIESGVRFEYFSRLCRPSALLFRNSIIFATGRDSRGELFFGTFAENPAGKILEPYQVLIHARLNELEPVLTKLVSLRYHIGPITIGVFKKQISNLPLVVPNYAYLMPKGKVENGFISVQSEGEAGFVGGDISFKVKDVLSSRLDLSGFYSYSNAKKYHANSVIRYEFDATHTLNSRGDFRLSKIASLGAELTIRSGYPYTPAYTDELFTDESRYTREFYTRVISRENSLRFPAHVMFNIRAAFDIGRGELFLAVSNLTDHDNPIVSTIDGFIYDTGILPSIGVKYSF
jgi:hypothetical protein